MTHYARPLLDQEIALLTQDLSSRDGAIIWACLGAGLRAQEAARMRVGHLGSDGSLCIPTTSAKGEKARNVYLTEQAHIALLRHRETLKDQSVGAPMFPSRKRCRGELQCLQPGSVVDLIKDLMVRREITNASSHSLRRTHSTGLRDRCAADLLIIKGQLGHSSLVVTERYMEVTPANHREVVRGLRFDV